MLFVAFVVIHYIIGVGVIVVLVIVVSVVVAFTDSADLFYFKFNIFQEVCFVLFLFY